MSILLTPPVKSTLATISKFSTYTDLDGAQQKLPAKFLLCQFQYKDPITHAWTVQQQFETKEDTELIKQSKSEWNSLFAERHTWLTPYNELTTCNPLIISEEKLVLSRTPRGAIYCEARRPTNTDGVWVVQIGNHPQRELIQIVTCEELQKMIC